MKRPGSNSELRMQRGFSRLCEYRFMEMGLVPGGMRESCGAVELCVIPLHKLHLRVEAAEEPAFEGG